MFSHIVANRTVYLTQIKLILLTGVKWEQADPMNWEMIENVQSTNQMVSQFFTPQQQQTTTMTHHLTVHCRRKVARWMRYPGWIDGLVQKSETRVGGVELRLLPRSQYQGRIKWRAWHAALGCLKLHHILKRCASSNCRKNDKYFLLNEISRLHRFTYYSTRLHLSRRHFMLHHLYFLLYYPVHWELCWPTQPAY